MCDSTFDERAWVGKQRSERADGTASNDSMHLVPLSFQRVDGSSVAARNKLRSGAVYRACTDAVVYFSALKEILYK